MKNALALTAIASSLFLATPRVQASEFVTLSNYGDSIELKAGETALVVSASDNLVVQYDKKTYPVRSSQFRLAASGQEHHEAVYRVGRKVRRYVPSWNEPFPLAGPCKIKLMTSGVVGMRVVSED